VRLIPESKRLNVLLREFRSSRHHLAVVVDEYGGVAGLVTIEDVLEEIVGDIDDEHDDESNPDAAIRLLPDGRHNVSALTPIADFNSAFGSDFSDDEYDTIGGLVTARFGHLPDRRGHRARSIPLPGRQGRRPPRAPVRRHRGRRVNLVRGLLLVLLIGLGTPAVRGQAIDPDSGSAFRIALVTAAPGAVYWQRFGHNALLVENTVTGDARLYNFGIFDFEQKNFLLNFVRGRMIYRLAAFAPDDDLANYASEGRSVWIQELNLSPEQRHAVAEMLGQNALPEHAEYRYDYFAQNCSTRVRDVLDTVLEGRLKETMSARARGETDRSLAMAYARPEPWLAIGIDLGLGPAADRKLSFWDEMFLPLRLRELLRDMRVTDAQGIARPLVTREWTAYDGRLDDQVPAQPRWLWPPAGCRAVSPC
jgi:hypothetical protein